MNPDLFLRRPQPEGLVQISNLLLSLDLLGNPEEIASLSPGLRGTSYPGSNRKKPQPI